MTTKLLRYLRDPAVATWRKATGLLAVIYVASPIDIVPDVFPIIGWLDDLGVIGALAVFMVREVRKHSEKVSASSSAPPPPQPPR